MERFEGLHAWVLRWPRGVKRAVMIVSDALVVPVLMYLAHAIRLGELAWGMASPALLVATPILTLPVLYASGVYRGIVRYLGSEVVWGIVLGVTISSGFLAGFTYMAQLHGTPRSVFVIFWLLSVLYLGGSRFLARRYFIWMMEGHVDRGPVAIFGAGSSGAQLASALANSIEYAPVLFADDNPALKGTTLAGIPITDRAGLAKAARRKRIESVLLAIPSETRQRRREIINFLDGLGVSVKSVPAFPDIVSGKARIEELREVSIEDLLGRDPVPPRPELLNRCIEGRAVLVTGAGGSIGTELCRQIASLNPRRLVMVDHAEYSLYSIEQELTGLALEHGIELTALLGSVVDGAFIESVCRDFGIETLYHAAAYKHVPMVENSAAAGVRNNVFGTLNTARAAESAGVTNFILISTDKAVRPTNIMGATKRFAEMLLQDMHRRGSKTCFSMVRFGNVLGSSGSVVPLFRRQIKEGGPVTVTHPDVVRYFMTIPEAAQLVLQAGGMARGGDVFLLDMGEPVRIYDLACTMIHLMGLSVRDESNPNGDIGIVFSGLRPGEKLYEELLIGEASEPTDHPMIMRAREDCLPSQELEELLESLVAVQSSEKGGTVKAILQRAVSGYRPDASVDQTPAGQPVAPEASIKLH